MTALLTRVQRIEERQPSATATSAGPPPSILDWATAEARILDPLTGLQPFQPYPYQARLLEDRTPRRLVLKARQTGLSLTIALEALYFAIHQPPFLALFISRSQDLAQQLITYCQHALSGLRTLPRLERESLSELKFENQSRILALPANPGAGRGFPASALYLDEFAWCQYAQQIYDGAVPAVAPGGQVTVLSTPQGRANLYFRLWEGLEGGQWARHQVHWSDCPRYDEAWAEAKRQEMTREAFAQEYDLDFVASGAAVFDPADLARAKEGWQPDPAGCERYVTAWDIGRRQDWTVGVTFGLRGDVWHEVAFWRGRLPYPLIQRAIAERAAVYGVPYVESNGVGDPVIENLDCHATPFVTTAKSKVQAIEALKLWLQQGRLKYGSEALDRELSLYQWQDQDIIQDSVIAAAIAAWAAQDSAPPNFY